MQSSNTDAFERLKAAVVQRFRQSYPAYQLSVAEWKGEQIVFFQEELRQAVQGSISEKWFYTYFKGNPQKLPRIDMLNLLCRYIDYRDWQHFLYAEIEKPAITPRRSLRTFLPFALVLLGVLVLAGVGIGKFSPSENSVAGPPPTSESYTFCFVDADMGTELPGDIISIHMIKAEESPKRLPCDSSGCVTFFCSEKRVDFVVQVPYYKRDTIRRTISKPGKEEISLKVDDYALMIHVFSNQKIEDWNQRRSKLSNMIADEAEIYQIFSETGLGMELYNKEEFINKLTMPLNSLKNIEIIETSYDSGKIIKMRFYQKEGQDEAK